MKKITLLELRGHDLDCREPVVSRELLIRGIRYSVSQVKPRKARRPKWPTRNTGQQQGGWQVLVERLEEAT